MAIKCLFTPLRIHKIMDYSTFCFLCPCRACREHVAFFRRRRRFEKMCDNNLLAHMCAVEEMTDEQFLEFVNRE